MVFVVGVSFLMGWKVEISISVYRVVRCFKKSGVWVWVLDDVFKNFMVEVEIVGVVFFVLVIGEEDVSFLFVIYFFYFLGCSVSMFCVRLEVLVFLGVLLIVFLELVGKY